MHVPSNPRAKHLGRLHDRYLIEYTDIFQATTTESSKTSGSNRSNECSTSHPMASLTTHIITGNPTVVTTPTALLPASDFTRVPVAGAWKFPVLLAAGGLRGSSLRGP